MVNYSRCENLAMMVGIERLENAVRVSLLWLDSHQLAKIDFPGVGVVLVPDELQNLKKSTITTNIILNYDC